MKKSILITDDKIEVAKVLMIYLAIDYNITYFENPVKAIDWLQRGNIPDLIISDLNMPEMDGSEFLHFLKSSEAFKSIPVVILSSVESSEDRIHLLEEGADDYLLKPFNPQEIKTRIKKILM